MDGPIELELVLSDKLNNALNDLANTLKNNIEEKKEITARYAELIEFYTIPPTSIESLLNNPAYIAAGFALATIGILVVRHVFW